MYVYDLIGKRDDALSNNVDDAMTTIVDVFYMRAQADRKKMARFARHTLHHHIYIYIYIYM